MPTVKELRAAIKSHKSGNCPPYSRMKKAALLKFVNGKSIPVKSSGKKKSKKNGFIDIDEDISVKKGTRLV